MDSVRSSLETVGASVNRSLQAQEPWKLVVRTAGATLVAVWVWNQLNHEHGVFKRVKKTFFRLARKIPAVKKKIKEETEKMQRDINADVIRMNEGMPFLRQLPSRGLPAEVVIDEAQKYCTLGKFSWADGRLSGTVYHGGEELTTLMTKVYGLAAWSNPLHPDVFPGVRKMEAEVVRMCCGLFHGGPGSCGSVTSGGTESIIMAMKACRDYGSEVLGISRPEVLVPFTAHAAFDKGAQLLRMKLTHISVDPHTSRVNVDEMRRHINRNTVMLVCSAPAFPHGNIDPIEAVAALGVRYKVPVHVDACLGGFLIPFMEEAGFPLPPFDFRVPGVTSISADTHKYGYAPKGSSVVMYATDELRHYQYFVQPDWPGGIYASPSMAGSRAGAVIAACWATLMHHGRQGYVDATRKVIQVAKYIEQEARKIPGLRIQGSPDVSVVAFASDNFNIYRLSDALGKRGWNFNALQQPSSFHIAVTFCMTKPGVKEQIVSDLKELTADIMKNPGPANQEGHAALYGMAASVPDRSLVSELAWCFLDGMYTTSELPTEHDSKANGKVGGS